MTNIKGRYAEEREQAIIIKQGEVRQFWALLTFIVVGFIAVLF